MVTWISGRKIVTIGLLIAFFVGTVGLNSVLPVSYTHLDVYKRQVLVSLFSHFLRAYRWNYLLKPAGYTVKTSNAIGAVLVGYFANYGLPRMGEITRCTLVTRYDKVPFEVALGTVITERIIDTLLLLSLIHI